MSDKKFTNTDFIVTHDKETLESQADLLLEIIKSKDTIKQKGLGTLGEIFEKLSTNKLALFRTTKESNIIHQIWVSNAIKTAEEVAIKHGLKLPQNRLSKDCLISIAQMSRKLATLDEIKEFLLERGIILIVEEYIPASRIDGAAFKIFDNIPVATISLRYRRIDSIWFTLLHELSHILLHFDEIDRPIIDDLDEVPTDKIERQANLQAKFSIISKDEWRSCKARATRRSEDVLHHANRLGIHPALLAGLIRFDQNNYKLFNDIIYMDDIERIL